MEEPLVGQAEKEELHQLRAHVAAQAGEIAAQAGEIADLRRREEALCAELQCERKRSAELAAQVQDLERRNGYSPRISERLTSVGLWIDKVVQSSQRELKSLESEVPKEAQAPESTEYEDSSSNEENLANLSSSDPDSCEQDSSAPCSLPAASDASQPPAVPAFNAMPVPAGSCVAGPAADLARRISPTRSMGSVGSSKLSPVLRSSRSAGCDQPLRAAPAIRSNGSGRLGSPPSASRGVGAGSPLASHRESRETRETTEVRVTRHIRVHAQVRVRTGPGAVDLGQSPRERSRRIRQEGSQVTGGPRPRQQGNAGLSQSSSPAPVCQGTLSQPSSSEAELESTPVCDVGRSSSASSSDDSPSEDVHCPLLVREDGCGDNRPLPTLFGTGDDRPPPTPRGISADRPTPTPRPMITPLVLPERRECSSGPRDACVPLTHRSQTTAVSCAPNAESSTSTPAPAVAASASVPPPTPRGRSSAPAAPLVLPAGSADVSGICLAENSALPATPRGRSSAPGPSSCAVNSVADVSGASLAETMPPATPRGRSSAPGPASCLGTSAADVPGASLADTVAPATPRGRSSGPVASLAGASLVDGSLGASTVLQETSTVSGTTTPRGRSSSVGYVVTEDMVPSTPRGRAMAEENAAQPIWVSAAPRAEAVEAVSRSGLSMNAVEMAGSAEFQSGATTAATEVAWLPSDRRSPRAGFAGDRSVSTTRRSNAQDKYFVEVISPRRARELEKSYELLHAQRSAPAVTSSCPAVTPVAAAPSSPRNVESPHSPPMLIGAEAESELGVSDDEERGVERSVHRSQSSISVSSNEGDIRDRLRQTLCLEAESEPQVRPVVVRQGSNGSGGLTPPPTFVSVPGPGWASPAAPTPRQQGARPPQAPGSWQVRRSDSNGPMKPLHATAPALKAGSQTPPPPQCQQWVCRSESTGPPMAHVAASHCNSQPIATWSLGQPSPTASVVAWTSPAATTPAYACSTPRVYRGNGPAAVNSGSMTPRAMSARGVAPSHCRPTHDAIGRSFLSTGPHRGGGG